MFKTLTGHTLALDSICLTLAAHEPVRVVVAIPHDGLITSDLTGMFAPRHTGVTLRDTHVTPIVNDVVRLCSPHGVMVNAVRCLMPRGFIDVNRGEGEAWQDWQMRDVYHHYHERIDTMLRRSVAAYGCENVLFLDMHGFDTQPTGMPEASYDVILGTCNRATVLHGALDHALAHTLGASGFGTFLPTEVPVRAEGDPFRGGYSVRTYAERYNVNAIQIEMHSSLRTRASEKRGIVFARVLSEFIRTHFR